MIAIVTPQLFFIGVLKKAHNCVGAAQIIDYLTDGNELAAIRIDNQLTVFARHFSEKNA